jgi:hypothetical protein
MRESPAAPRASERLIAVIAPAIVPAIAVTASDTPALAVATIQPAEVSAPAAPVPLADPAPERTVHVRIGAIEIYGPDAGLSEHTPAAIAPSAVAAPSFPAPPAGGFDDYAALRSYAPWAW